MDFFRTKVDIMVIYANAFDSKGEDGEIINGCTVHYLFWGDGGTALIGQSEPDITKPVGMQRGKSWVDYELRNKIRIAPAIYEGTFKMDVDSKGKSMLKLVDIAYKSNVKMEAYKLDGLFVPGMVDDVDSSPDPTQDLVTSASEEALGSTSALDSDHKTTDNNMPSSDSADKEKSASSSTPSLNASSKDNKSRKQS